MGEWRVPDRYAGPSGSNPGLIRGSSSSLHSSLRANRESAVWIPASAGMTETRVSSVDPASAGMTETGPAVSIPASAGMTETRVNSMDYSRERFS